jgi:hypothetical protein
VSGGRFTNITHVHLPAPRAPPSKLEHSHSVGILTLMTDFRTIPLGDLNLVQEIGFRRGANVVHRKNGGNSVRRMYTARVEGCKSNMTVALYQGNGAEDVCFLLCCVYPVFIFLHRDGGHTSHNIQTFGETIHPTILTR